MAGLATWEPGASSGYRFANPKFHSASSVPVVAAEKIAI